MSRGSALLRFHPWLMRRIALAAGVSLFLLLGACATVGKLSVPSGPDLTALFPENSFAYASIKVSQNAGLVADILKQSGLSSSIPSSVLIRTNRMYASAQYDSGKKSTFALVGEGEYPTGLIGWRLSWSRDWKRSDKPIRWWQDRKTGTQIALPTKNLVMVSNGQLPAMLRNLGSGRVATLNPTIRQALETSDLAIYFPNVTDNLPVLGMEANRFPVQTFYFSINADGGGAPDSASTPSTGYHGYAVFKMKSERDARLFSVVFKLLIASSEHGSAIKGFPIPLKGAQLSVDGDTIRLDGITVGEADLSELVSKVIGGNGETK